MKKRRQQRQDMVFEWVTNTFGPDHANSARQRATRFLEEAIELYQACGGDHMMARNLVEFVMAKPVGDIHKELGDVGLTLLSVAAATGLDADHAEVETVTRAFMADPRDMAERNKAKNAAGFDADAYPTKPYSEQPFNERERS